MTDKGHGSAAIDMLAEISISLHLCRAQLAMLQSLVLIDLAARPAAERRLFVAAASQAAGNVGPPRSLPVSPELLDRLQFQVERLASEYIARLS